MSRLHFGQGKLGLILMNFKETTDVAIGIHPLTQPIEPYGVVDWDLEDPQVAGKCDTYLHFPDERSIDNFIGALTKLKEKLQEPQDG